MHMWRRRASARSLPAHMARTTDLSRPIIEALYTEALLLADDVRAVFAAGTRGPLLGEDAFVRLALSTEGHRRIARLDEAWRQHFEMVSPARAFQERIGREFGRLG